MNMGTTPGDRLRETRKHMGVTLIELEVMSGVSKAMISSVERGIRPMRRNIAVACAEALGVDTLLYHEREVIEHVRKLK